MDKPPASMWVYTLVLVPGIVGLVVVGGREVWRARASSVGRIVLAVTTAATVLWSGELLDRTPTFLPWLRWVVVVLGLLVALAAVAVVVGAAGPAAYTLDTAFTAHSGGGISAGPPTAGGTGPNRGGRTGRGGRTADIDAARTRDGGATGPQPTALLKAAGTRWSAATVGSSAAASLELASTTAVMGIGGFTGSDPVSARRSRSGCRSSTRRRRSTARPCTTSRHE